MLTTCAWSRALPNLAPSSTLSTLPAATASCMWHALHFFKFHPRAASQQKLAHHQALFLLTCMVQRPEAMKDPTMQRHRALRPHIWYNGAAAVLSQACLTASVLQQLRGCLWAQGHKLDMGGTLKGQPHPGVDEHLDTLEATELLQGHV